MHLGKILETWWALIALQDTGNSCSGVQCRLCKVKRIHGEITRNISSMPMIFLGSYASNKVRTVRHIRACLKKIVCAHGIFRAVGNIMCSGQ